MAKSTVSMVLTGTGQDFGSHGAAMFAAGALLGPALDGVAHGNFGVRHGVAVG